MNALKGINQGGRCACGGCGRTFSGLSTFDGHFATLDSPPWSLCLDPAGLLTKAGEAKYRCDEGVWRSPAENPRWAVSLPVEEPK